MVSRHLRSRSIKRRSVRVPGGKSVVHYNKEKPKKHSCGRCGKELHGTPNAIPSEIRSMRKTERVPEKPYAGILCGECLEDLMRYKTKFEVKFQYPEFSEMDFNRDLTIEKFLPGGWWKDVSAGKKEKPKKEKVKPKKTETAEKAAAKKEMAAKKKEEAEAKKKTAVEKPKKKPAKKGKPKE
jgi:large subunit ribosomal protein L34e